MLDSVLSRRFALAAVLILVVGGVVFIRAISFRFWEGTLRGPYVGIPIAPAPQARIDSQLELPRRHLLEVSNAFTNAGGDEWPLVALKSPNGEVMWARVLQPIVKQAGTN